MNTGCLGYLHVCVLWVRLAALNVSTPSEIESGALKIVFLILHHINMILLLLRVHFRS